MSDVKFDDKELQKILKEIKQKIPDIKVGILGDKVSRNGPLNNAEIGAIHEFGTITMPQRSFLRMPIQENLAKVIDNYPKQKKLNVIDMANKIGVAAVSVIIAAFASNGFGSWKRSNKGFNGIENDTLIDTGQLRDSITYEID